VRPFAQWCRRRALTITFGLLGAAPSLLWALRHPSLIHDDWAFAAMVRFHGVWATVVDGLHTSGRPLHGLYFGIAFGIFGTHPVPHALLLALLNGVSAVLVWTIACQLASRRLALFTTIAWVVLANRSSGHYWFSAGPEMLAVCLLLGGVLLLCRHRPRWAAVALIAAVLTYEATLVLALLAIAGWVWQERGARRRWCSGAAVATAVTAAAGFVWLHSPKRDTAVHLFAHPGNWVAAQMGTGIFGTRAGTVVGSSIVIIALTIASAKMIMPGFVATSSERRLLLGAAVSMGGLLPFLAVGFPVATDGLFDRGNIVADLGTAIVLGILLASAARLPRVLAAPVLAVAIAALALPGVHGLATYIDAAKDGRELQAGFASDLPTLDKPLVVGPPLPNTGGVAAFLTSWDTGAYLQLSHDDPHIHARMACSPSDFATASEAITYNRLRHAVVQRASTTYGSAECAAMGL
jgi:hypothetical protein